MATREARVTVDITGVPEYRALVAKLADRERELLKLKGPCSGGTVGVGPCRLHYAHSGPCDIPPAFDQLAARLAAEGTDA